MKKIIVRADDLGYSCAVNYGIYEATHRGIVNNVSLMVTLPFSEHGWELLKNESDTDVGLHVVICAGKPLSDPKLVSSLVQEDGSFKRSQVYHDAFEQGKDIVDYEDAVREVEAQYECFVEMTKREPDYLAGHTVLSLNFIRALRDVASEHQIPYLSFDVEHEVEFQGQKLTPFMEDFSLDYDPVATLAHVLSAADKRPHVIPELILHPGFLDQFILQHSHLVYPRTLDVEMATSGQAIEMIERHDVQLVRYSELVDSAKA